ncbi:MAG: hypothetical protein U9N49_03190, partial [Campylobacterota bacterium]|nr:hypothetical protein [Campylobacterota bacterium]
IQVANQEGQKIFTITKDNYQEIIPQLNLASSAIADIESAAKANQMAYLELLWCYGVRKVSS